jgi:hypothetical protein
MEITYSISSIIIIILAAVIAIVITLAAVIDIVVILETVIIEVVIDIEIDIVVILEAVIDMDITVHRINALKVLFSLAVIQYVLHESIYEAALYLRKVSENFSTYRVWN